MRRQAASGSVPPKLQSTRRLPAATDRADNDGEAQPGLTSADIVAIAREAGIDPEFVEQALGEAAFTPAALAGDSEFRIAQDLEGDVLELQRIVQDVVTGKPFELRLIDIRTSGDARVLLFQNSPHMGGTLNAGGMAAAANILDLHVLLRPAGRPGHTSVVLFCEENPALPRSARQHDVAFATLGGLIGGGAGVGIGVATGVLIPPVAIGALAVGALGVRFIRGVQRWSRRTDIATLDQLAREIAGAVRIHRHSGTDPSLPPA